MGDIKNPLVHENTKSNVHIKCQKKELGLEVIQQDKSEVSKPCQSIESQMKKKETESTFLKNDTDPSLTNSNKDDENVCSKEAQAKMKETEPSKMNMVYIHKDKVISNKCGADNTDTLQSNNKHMNSTSINTDNLVEIVPPPKQVYRNSHTNPESQKGNDLPIKSYSAAMKTNVIQATINNNRNSKQQTKTLAVAKGKNCPMKPSKHIEDVLL